MSTTSKLLVLLSLTLTVLLMVFGGGFRRSLDGDALGYYMYLPSTFIYHNNKSLDVLPADRNIDPHLLVCARDMAAAKTPLGYTRNQYTIGIAIAEAPFFFVAHALEKICGAEANGYSETYTNMLLVSGFVYALLGLLLVYKVLKRYFSEAHAHIGAQVIFWGTNLFWFTLFQPGMAHVPLFFFYGLLVWLTVKLHESPRMWLFMAVGFVVGIITLIRPVDVICLLIPLIYNVYDKQTVVAKMRFLAGNIRYIIPGVLMFVLPLIPQLLYWKMMSGSYVYYSYGEQSFDWLHPKIIDGLFSAHNGWLSYTPVMLFAIVGLAFYRTIKVWAWVLWIIVPLYVYIIYSWYCYNYINGFGSRPMIHLYPLLAIPLTACISAMAQWKIFPKVLISLLLMLFVSVNISYSLQQGKYMLLSEESNATFNMQVLFKSRLNYNDLVVFDVGEPQPDTGSLTKIGTIAFERFEDSVSDRYVKDTVYGSKYVYKMLDEPYHPKSISLKYSKELFKDARWVKCSGKFMYPYPAGYYKHKLVFNIQDLLWRSCRIENKIDVLSGECKPEDITLKHLATKKWGRVVFYVRLPHSIEEGKDITFGVWNEAKLECYIDDLCLELYR